MQDNGIDISKLSKKELEDLICDYLAKGYDYVIRNKRLYLFKIVN